MVVKLHTFIGNGYVIGIFMIRTSGTVRSVENHIHLTPVLSEVVWTVNVSLGYGELQVSRRWRICGAYGGSPGL